MSKMETDAMPNVLYELSHFLFFTETKGEKNPWDSKCLFFRIRFFFINLNLFCSWMEMSVLAHFSSDELSDEIKESCCHHNAVMDGQQCVTIHRCSACWVNGWVWMPQRGCLSAFVIVSHLGLHSHTHSKCVTLSAQVTKLIMRERNKHISR